MNITMPYNEKESTMCSTQQAKTTSKLSQRQHACTFGSGGRAAENSSSTSITWRGSKYASVSPASTARSLLICKACTCT